MPTGAAPPWHGYRRDASSIFHAPLSFAQHQTLLAPLAKWVVAVTLATPWLAFNGLSSRFGPHWPL